MVSKAQTPELIAVATRTALTDSEIQTPAKTGMKTDVARPRTITAPEPVPRRIVGNTSDMKTVTTDQSKQSKKLRSAHATTTESK